MESLAQNLRFALRLIRREPLFAAGVILTLALGIGANTAVFTVVNSVLLEPLPYSEPDRLTRVWENDRLNNTTREWASVPDYFDFVERNQVFDLMGGYSGATLTLTESDSLPESLTAFAMTHTMFPLLGIEPIAGRWFDQSEDTPGGPQVAVISSGLWQRRFGSDPGIIGRPVSFDGTPYTVVGVMPNDFQFPAPATDAWIPLYEGPTTASRGVHNLRTFGRLKPGIEVAAAQADMTTIASQLEKEYPGENVGRGVDVLLLKESMTGAARPALLVFMAAVAAVLLIACANVANLQLTRSVARRRELAIQRALGADTMKLIRQPLVDSVVLAVMGGLAGTAMAYGAVRALSVLNVGALPRAQEITIDTTVIMFALALSVATGLIFGTGPALAAARGSVEPALKKGGRDARSGRAGSFAASALVVAEIGLALLLVAGAGLLIRSFWNLQQVHPGFNSDGLVKFDFTLPATRYPTSFNDFPNWPEVQRFQSQLLERARSLPGVDQATIAYSHPADPGFTTSFTLDGEQMGEGGQRLEVRIRIAADEYFQTVGIPLLQGRPILETDRADSPTVLVINEAFQRRFIPDDDPLGKRVQVFGREFEIVGVVGNVNFMGLEAAIPPAVYPPLPQMPFGFFRLITRTAGAPGNVVAGVRNVVRELDPALPVDGILTMNEVLGTTASVRRFNTGLLVGFAAVALILAAVGIYGTMAHAVTRRTHEIGLRMALGADRGKVLAMILREGGRLTVAGTVVGILGAFGLTRLMSSLLFGIEATDPATFAGVAIILALVALTATYIPARRATRVDPLVALRHE